LRVVIDVKDTFAWVQVEAVRKAIVIKPFAEEGAEGVGGQLEVSGHGVPPKNDVPVLLGGSGKDVGDVIIGIVQRVANKVIRPVSDDAVIDVPNNVEREDLRPRGERACCECRSAY